jgi:hypothetical protein
MSFSDFVLGSRGALSFELTIPISQKQDMEASNYGETLSVKMNVGGTELTAAYRFYY